MSAFKSIEEVKEALQSHEEHLKSFDESNNKDIIKLKAEYDAKVATIRMWSDNAKQNVTNRINFLRTELQKMESMQKFQYLKQFDRNPRIIEMHGKDYDDTGPMKLEDFVREPNGIRFRQYDIIATNVERDFGLWFITNSTVPGDDTLYVEKTPGDYLWPTEALTMFIEFNIETFEDIKKLYDGFPYDLYGIEIKDTVYTLRGSPFLEIHDAYGPDEDSEDNGDDFKAFNLSDWKKK
jgi:hypothetical protein